MTLKQGTLVKTPSRKIIWIVAIISIITAAGYIYYSNHNLATRKTTNSATQPAVAQRGDLVVSASGTGTLIANSDATFGFQTSGQVTDVNVKVGDQVQAGQVIAQLDDTLAQMNYLEAQQALQELYSAASIAAVEKEIATAQDTEYYAHEWLKYLLSPEVVEAEENLAIAQQKLTEAQAEATANSSDTANQVVKEKEQAVAYLKDKLTQAQQYYENAYLPETFGVYENVGSRRHPKQVLATYIDPKTGEKLPEIDTPSADDIATARNNYVQAQETVKEGQMYLEVLKAGNIPDGATGEKLTALYEAQLAVDNAISALEAKQLVAPISGTVTSLDLGVGEQVDTASVITISKLSQPYTLDAYFDEADWKMAQVGNHVNVTFALLPEQTFPFLTFIITALTACGNAPRSTSANSNFATQNGSAACELPVTTQIALGTLKLDGTDQAITAKQASDLLPLWETMQVLENSDTAAPQEIEALSAQIQETMTKEQMQTITAMNLTRQDMFAVMQAQGGRTGNGRQFGNTQNGTSSANGNRNFGGGFGPGAGGPPPDGGGFQGFGGQGQNRSAAQIATAQAARQAGGGNRIPAPLINALIELLKNKVGT